VRAQLQLGRATGEVINYSADVYSYFTAFSEQPLWAGVADAFRKPEGELFPGLVVMVLAAIGVFSPRQRSDESAFAGADAIAAPARPARHQWLAWLFGALALAYLAAALVTMLYRRLTVDLVVAEVHLGDITRLLAIASAWATAMLWLSPRARSRAVAFMRSRGFFMAALAAAVWLSLGPSPESLGRPIDLWSPYRVLYEYVPGFDGLRVPARFATIVTLLLAILGGFGAAAVLRLRLGRPLLAAAMVLFFAESLTLPMGMNGVTPPPDYAAPEPRLYRPARAPRVYHEIAALPRDAVIAELPLGQPDYDLRAMYYSVAHWRPLVNGYSGFFPPHYAQLATAVSDVPRHPDVALAALRSLGTTAVVVHEAAYLGDEGSRISAALQRNGAVERFRDGGDVLFVLP
jgi:hypothetical protein